jgi:hypothetical protein
MEKRRLRSISDLKNKNEGFSHAILKTRMCDFIREIGQKTKSECSVKTEAIVKGIGKVDISAKIDKATIAVECGGTDMWKIAKLRQKFDIVLHVPYCFTSDLYHLDAEQFEHQVMVSNLIHEFRERGLPEGEKGRPICLEEGECSLPSGRMGYPKEAIELANEAL